MTLYDLPADSAAMSLPILRVNPGGTFAVCLCSAKPLSLATHWLNRSIVCVGADCPLCEHGHARITHFFAVRSRIAGKVGPLCLMELSSSSWGRLQGLLAMEGSTDCVGSFVEVSRKRANSSIIAVPAIDIPRAQMAGVDLTRVLDALCVLLKLPLRLPGEDCPTWANRVKGSLIDAARSAVLVG